MSTPVGALLLVLTGALVLAASVLMIQSIRLDDALRSCAAMIVVMAAGVPASIYGAVST